MAELTAVGVVPDEVLLLCGRPESVPSAWWTPRLDGLDEEAVDQLLDDARRTLDELGVRDPATGALRGLLAEVAAVVAGADVLLLLAGSDGTRRAVIAAPDAAVLDLQVEDGHDLLLATPRATARLVADLLWSGVEPSAAFRELAGTRTPAEVAAVLPEDERATLVVTRSDTVLGVHLVTVLSHADGSVACWALPDDRVHVQVLDEDGAVDLALLLLGAGTGEVAA